jgi:translation initiation factor IF-1
MLKLLKSLARQAQIDNIQDAVVVSLNPDSTYNIRLRSGAIKKSAINASSMTYNIGDIVNISMVTGQKETAKIIGKGTRRAEPKTIEV